MPILIDQSKAALTAEKLKEAETLLGITLPPEYAKFLLEYNGGRPTPCEFIFSEGKEKSRISHFLAIYKGESSNLLHIANIMSGRIPGDMVPIAYDDFGNLILIGVTGLRKGQIFFWDHEKENQDDAPPLSYLAGSFLEFLATLH